ncbi:tetratricopeptide repeat protein [Azospirillum sp. TSO35-2]|uniref:tetratricopeptide repeat protein n=1 Tax=Azospirillum sp. TSO35-2 TaxID=716796 RepID=UPI000D61EB75|nr:tetratricopeptide repeat protein [Azospirillum sp. TSO35-2]PWC31260.1 hypothetical protein TSO352_31215 [Azospirillum sp. TSO35-2]
MDFGFLTIPIYMAVVAFGFAVFTDTHTVNIEYVDVPDAIAGETGYTSPVVVARIADEMQSIARQANTKAEVRKVELHEDKKPVAVLSEFVGLTPLVRVVQESASLIPFSFSGEIVIHGDDLQMRLRGYDSHHHQVQIQQEAHHDELPKLIRATSYEAMRIVNPYILAAYQFRRDRLTRDFTPTLEIIHREMENHETEYAKWMLNLWGMVLYQQADRQGAIEKFREAYAIDREFLSPLLNWGVAEARIGNHTHAIELFKAVTTNRAAAYNPSAAAAAYSEWGFSLALTGRFDEAYEKFQTSANTDASFADVYSSWAEVLSVQGHKDEAAKMTARALTLAPTEVVYTENLIGTVQNLPATASVH